MTETRDLLSEKLQRRKASDLGDDKVARCNLALLAHVDLALPLVLVARELIINPDGLAEAGGGELLSSRSPACYAQLAEEYWYGLEP